MATKKSAAEECCAKCEKDIAALRKEIAALKSELSKKASGGADARVGKLIEAVKKINTDYQKAKEILDNL